MIIEVGEYVHVIYRAYYENSTRRHFLGEVKTAQGSVCRLEGYVFVLDKKSSTFIKRSETRTTIVDLAESGYIVNVIDPGVNLGDVVYKYQEGAGLVAMDGKRFSMNINEYSSKY